MINLKKIGIGAFAAVAFVGTQAQACTITVDDNTGEPPPAAAVSFSGDEGLAAIFTVVALDDADVAATEVVEGVYVSEGELENGAVGSCQFRQTRELEVTGKVRAEVVVSDATLDVDENVAAPEPVVLADDPATEESELRVTLLPGDTFASEGCQDWVKVAEVA